MACNWLQRIIDAEFHIEQPGCGALRTQPDRYSQLQREKAERDVQDSEKYVYRDDVTEPPGLSRRTFRAN